MSMVSSDFMSRFLPFSSHHQAQSCAENLGVGNNEFDCNEIAAITVADFAGQLKNLAMAAAIAIAEEVIAVPSHDSNSTINSNPKTTPRVGGLKRTVSSLQSGMPSMNGSSQTSCCSSLASSLASSSSDMFCSHSNHRNTCIVEAKQVEIEFVTFSATPFRLLIRAPNGECSAKFFFKNYGATESFSPQRSDCGHGTWTFEMSTFTGNKKLLKKWTESIYLDGVGSLFFSVDENLQIRLLSQEFLRLPSASQCCQKNSARK